MSQTNVSRIAFLFSATWLTIGCLSLRAEDTKELKEELRLLREQNQGLQKQIEQQQGMIEALSRKVGEIEQVQVTTRTKPSPVEANPADAGAMSSGESSTGFGTVRISGEGGVAFMHTGSEGTAPNGEFRLDEARLFVEAPIYHSTYFYGELNLATREEPDVQVRLGEAYLDVENVSQLWNRDHQLNLRAGRMYIPFGEEYLTRYAIDNPLISHSLSDLWGVDEGIELYGSLGKFCYAAAVQNGGIPDTRDFTSDKSIAGRISFDPTRHIHMSVSGMRTGAIDVHQDQLSAMWFGGGFFRSLGSASTTQFHADLVEGDVAVELPHGQIKAFGGYIHYGDNDPNANNSRDVFYYSVEGVHDIVGKLYGAARFSQILAPDGFPIVGNGEFDDYLFGPLTTDLWRLSLDLGYRWSQNLVLKVEYTFERGQTVSGEKRDHEDLFALEAAFKF
jgi:hypothetical protein